MRSRMITVLLHKQRTGLLALMRQNGQWCIVSEMRELYLQCIVAVKFIVKHSEVYSEVE